jgi:hypothetical protein
MIPVVKLKDGGEGTLVEVDNASLGANILNRSKSLDWVVFEKVKLRIETFYLFNVGFTSL